MRYYFIAGEASGDLHGGMLIEAMKRHDIDMEYRFWGGENMAAFGGEMVKHYKETAFMGFWEVLKHLKTIKRNLSLCSRELLHYKPDALILIDYPGFNLRVAKFAKELSIPVFYYISPKIWAWKTSRVHQIKKYVDAMFCILPFEKAFYARYGYPVYYIGNPLLDKIQHEMKMFTSTSDFIEENLLEQKPIIALLPGSRKQEIQRCLPAMAKAVKPYGDNFQFVVSGISTLPDELYTSVLNESFKLVYDQSYALLHHAHAAVVVSGTAVLEAAILQTPQLALYKISPISYLFKPLLKVKYFTLPNLILNKEAVKELLQHKLVRGIQQELHKLLFEEAHRQIQQNRYQVLMRLLGAPGAPERAAKIMIQRLQNQA